MRHVTTIIATLAALATLTTPITTRADEPPAPPEPPFVCVVLDQFIYMPAIGNPPTLRAIGGDCAPGTCNP